MRALMGLVLFAASLSVFSEELPIFDAHLHYSHDAWESVPPEDVIALLRKAGVRRALVSSSGDEGQQRLYRAAPGLIIPELRPYRRRGEIGTWFRDPTVVKYLEEKLAKYRYASIGEFHLYDSANADGPVAVYVVRNAEVIGRAASRGGAGLTSSSSAGFYVTVAVDADAALRLAAAIRANKIEVVKATGA